MEGIALILIGTAIFSHSWHLLGLYADARSVGVVMATLALAMVVTMFTGNLQLINDLDATSTLRDAAETSFQAIILIWAVYAGIVAAQGLWDMEERALGFYCVLPAVAGIVTLLLFGQMMIDGGEELALLPMIIVSAMLALVGAFQFFHVAFPFPALRGVTGWIMLVQSIIIVAIGMAMITAVITI